MGNAFLLLAIKRAGQPLGEEGKRVPPARLKLKLKVNPCGIHFCSFTYPV